MYYVLLKDLLFIEPFCVSSERKNKGCQECLYIPGKLSNICSLLFILNLGRLSRYHFKFNAPSHDAFSVVKNY